MRPPKWVVGNAVKFQQQQNCYNVAITNISPHFQEENQQLLSTKDLVAAAKACSISKDLATAKRIHSNAIQSGFQFNIFVATSLIDMFAKCRSMADAYTIFRRLPNHNAASYTALMLGNVDNGEHQQALDLLSGIELPDALCFVAALVACANLAANEEGHRIDGKLVKLKCLETGMDIHRQAAENGYETVTSLANTLVSMYAKCGSLLDARMIFDRISSHSVVSWNALILGYTENGEAELALEFFSRMQPEVCAADFRTYVAAITACTSLAAREEDKTAKLKILEKGMAIHSQAMRSGCSSQVFLASTLVNFYAKCGSLADASRVFERMRFRDLVSWTALVLGFAENGEGELALQLFSRMRDEGFDPDERTYVAAIKACGDLATREDGKQVDGKLVRMKCLERGFCLHAEAARRPGLIEANIFLATSLVDLYAQCGSLIDARVIFDRMRFHNMICWNALILGYASNGEAELALELFARMKDEAFAPENDSRAFVAALVACANLVALEAGRAIEESICRSGLERNGFVVNCLVDLYCKCGSMVNAQVIFDSICSRNLVTWSTLIGGYSRHGDAAMVFDLFRRLQKEGLEADKVTYLSVLAACSHAGLVQRGKDYFEEMMSAGMKPDIEHYDCMIDLLGRGNCVEEAAAMVKSMPYEPNLVTWNAVLGACRKWKNVEIGRIAFEALVKLDEAQGSSYLTMANIYGNAGMWEEQGKVLAMRNIINYGFRDLP